MIEKKTLEKLERTAEIIRKHIIEMIYTAQSGHPGGSLSAVEIITALYFKILNHKPKNPYWEDRDRFILSKGHAAPALYAVMAEIGYLPIEELLTLRKPSSRLQGHPAHTYLPGIEASTGSLGHGLSVGVGMALSAKLDNKKYRIYVLIGDGESDEGSIWEAVMSAGHYKLDNLTVFLDRNKLQIDGDTEKVMSLEPIDERFRAFGWNVIRINGHNFNEIFDAVEKAKNIKNKPTLIIALTTKGKGVSFMENAAHFHGMPPNKQEFESAINEINKKLVLLK